MRKLVTLLVVLMLYSIAALAQTKTITGSIASKDGQPIEGASVRLQGTKVGTVTNGKGEFKISAKEGQTLVISAIAFSSEKIVVGSDARYSVVLSQNANVMDEVVVTAGGLKSRVKEQGYAATQIKGEELTLAKPVDVASSLQGKVAGLEISDVSGGVNPNYRIVLRGQRSLLGNNQALVVVDGVVVPTAVLGNMNPGDIANIEVLNGASAVALYGSEASNGALVVTTKKGRRGVNSVSISNTVTLQSVAFEPKLQTTYGGGGHGYGVNPDGTPVFSDIENESYGPKFDGSMVPLGAPLIDGSQLMVPYANSNQRFKFWQTAVSDQTDFSVTSGNENSTMYLSGQYVAVNGTMPDDKYNRTTVRFNGTHKVTDQIQTAYTLGYTQNRYDETTDGGNIYNNLLNIPANVPITMFKDWRTNKFANPNGFENPWYLNPYFDKDNNRETVRNDYLVGSAEINYTPIKELTFTARLGLTTTNASSLAHTDKFTYTQYAINASSGSKSNISGSVASDANYYTRVSSDIYATFKKNTRNFTFSLTAGSSIRQNKSSETYATVSGLVVPGLFNLSNSTNFPSASNSSYQSRLAGAFGDMKIGFNNYLFLEVTGRNDWVSILNPPNNSFFYPSFALSFAASDALAFLKNMKSLDYLKLRASWSKVGQVNLGQGDPNAPPFGAYMLQPTFSQAYGYPYQGVAGYSVGDELVQASLLPEITKEWELGGDFAFMKDRVDGNITYYQSTTSNQTIPAGVSSATGFSAYLLNSGEVSNKGLETKLNVKVLRNKNWMIAVGGNYAHYDNRVISINPALSQLSIAHYGDGSGSYAIPGQPFPVLMGFDYQRDKGGHVIVDGTTGLPLVNQSLVNLGGTAPKDVMGLDLTIRWKNISFYALFEYRGGNKIYNAGGPTFDWAGTGIRTVEFNRQRFVFPNSVYEDPSHPGSYIANKTVAIQNGNGNDGFWTDQTENMGVTSNYVTSGAFWKLRQISLSYDFPSSVLRKTRIIKGATISLQGRNLFEWLPKSNLYTDPEYSDAGSSSNGIGLTNLQSPPTRYYGGTVTLTF
jgi:TonB-linked SusC/RagA family outer membrane protein